MDSVNVPDILYEDEHLIAVNKAPGEAVQADRSGDVPLSDRLAAYLRERDAVQSPPDVGVTHRIDRPTSGVVLFAKRRRALEGLNRQFRENAVRKIYWAAVDTAPPGEKGTLVHGILFDRRTNRSRAVAEGTAASKRAVMSYRVIGRSERFVFLEIELETGRHHQIRAQLAAVGCHIKGDVKYGARRTNRTPGIHLHAREVAFIHPVSGERVSIVAPLPDDPVWNALSGGKAQESATED